MKAIKSTRKEVKLKRNWGQNYQEIVFQIALRSEDLIEKYDINFNLPTNFIDAHSRYSRTEEGQKLRFVINEVLLCQIIGSIKKREIPIDAYSFYIDLPFRAFIDYGSPDYKGYYFFKKDNPFKKWYPKFLLAVAYAIKDLPNLSEKNKLFLADMENAMFNDFLENGVKK